MATLVKAQSKAMTSSTAPDIAAMTWLEAAEHILKQEGPEMHIKDLTERVMNLGMVNSHCRTSLETLLYRQSHKPHSKFKRVIGRMGWFKLSNSVIAENNLSQSLNCCDEEEEAMMPKSVIVHKRKSKVIRREEEYGDCNREPDSDESDSSYSSTSDDEDDDDWSMKYRHIKGFAKRLIMTNVSLASELQSLENEISKSQQEKKYLLERLINKQSNARTTTTTNKQDQSKQATPVGGGGGATSVKVPTTPSNSNRLKRPLPSSPPVSHKPHPLTTPPTRSSEQRLIYNAISEPRDLFSTSSSSSNEEEEAAAGKRTGRALKEGTTKQNKASKEESIGTGGGGRKKRVRRLQAIPLHEDGSPVFPIKLGGLQVHSLGKVVWDRPSFHNERYIWPLGFKSTRSYPSMTNPSRRCLYTCHILDGKDGPIFEMVSEESPDSPIRASSATACHHIVLKAINEARDKQATNAGSGPEFFGFSHPSILNLIQLLPDADKCTKYKPTIFQQPLTRGKAHQPLPTSTDHKKPLLSSSAKKKEKPIPDSSLVGGAPLTVGGGTSDPSLAPVVNQLISYLSSDSDSNSNEYEHELVIDTSNSNRN
ncbi:PREDICTED: transforming growth factor beta regulator 1-like isoform X1 [Amphimedon queenslandica]|uniref:HTH HARE-type domain-containing protein n=1 Tax=Amphimedon queenslandica TaxID=400682 RepID=A0A1X7UUQ2_AMPQE|nr:PREDICTED: transforming growth factor beta regulator 1-like isoform X1 [Amphimedon queenslandica]|eukprot:XP_011404079.1 PREDICTED: transforming growth factor beta regulator 1-like isoform X1 [Amphimedon queenslandica]